MVSSQSPPITSRKAAQPRAPSREQFSSLLTQQPDNFCLVYQDTRYLSLVHGCIAYMRMIYSTKLASIYFSQVPGYKYQASLLDSLALHQTLIQGTSLASATVPTPPTSPLLDFLIMNKRKKLLVSHNLF